MSKESRVAVEGRAGERQWDGTERLFRFAVGYFSFQANGDRRVSRLHNRLRHHAAPGEQLRLCVRCTITDARLSPLL